MPLDSCHASYCTRTHGYTACNMDRPHTNQMECNTQHATQPRRTRAPATRHEEQATNNMPRATAAVRTTLGSATTRGTWHRSIAARTARRGPRGGRAGTVGRKGREGLGTRQAGGRSVSASVSRRGRRRRGGAKHQTWDDVRSVVVALSAQYCPSSRLGPQALMAVELSCGATPQTPIPCTRCS
jgi:hypothetical protein